ncbi:MAG: metallophosphoesterase family protein [Leptolyngbyaceae cyanobacterium SL_7_1]|nr:metallophosphoesterase family protein [Leptolyngbyaceae cyanobacterium SL_7_1]
MTTRIGVISDTHGLVRPEAIAALHSCDLILHAGDIGKAEVLQHLEAIAPVIAVRGNNDIGAWAESIPESTVVAIEGVAIYLLHIGNAFKPDSTIPDIRVVISGHSHKPAIEEQGTVLWLNPGSAGPRRFKLPISVAHLQVDGGHVKAQIIELVIP